MKAEGRIVKFDERQTGTSKSGKEWVKQTFVIDTGEEYNNILAFEVFGQDKVDNLNKYNKVGDKVSVEFNVQCNEWQGRYFTSLQAWRIEKAGEAGQEVELMGQGGSDDLPF